MLANFECFFSKHTINMQLEKRFIGWWWEKSNDIFLGGFVLRNVLHVRMDYIYYCSLIHYYQLIYIMLWTRFIVQSMLLVLCHHLHLHRHSSSFGLVGVHNSVQFVSEHLLQLDLWCYCKLHCRSAGLHHYFVTGLQIGLTDLSTGLYLSSKKTRSSGNSVANKKGKHLIRAI